MLYYVELKMGIIGVVLLVVFVIVCLLIVLLVLIQNEDGGGLGGLFAGGSNTAFGSRSQNVLTKSTYIVVSLFFLTAFFLAFLNKSPGDSGIEEAARIEQANTDVEWWNSEDTEQDAAATESAITEQAESVPAAE